MDYTILYFYEHIDIFLLIFVRMLSFFIAAPVFGGRNIPYFAKIGLAFFLALTVIWVIPIDGFVTPNNWIEMSIYGMQEFAVGLLIGFSVYMVYSIMFLAGQLIDTQIGFAMVNVIDPLSELQVTISGNLYYYLFIVCMLAVNAHHILIRSLIESYRILPIGGIRINHILFQEFTGFYSTYFILAFKIASPILATVFIMNVALAILARSAPQLNMFVVGIPVKLIIGLLVLFFMIPMIPNISASVTDTMIDYLFRLLKGLMP